MVTLTTFGGTSFCMGFPTYEDCKNLQIRLSHPIDAEIIFPYLIKPQFLQRLKTVFTNLDKALFISYEIVKAYGSKGFFVSINQ